ncbi:MAG: glycosyltransferase family 2 protein [Candidatus Vogelbacteria bacterium]|nr:glycosyltransferase family 2 protein [Candidatus Vogelbacteria bacterium]
MKTLSIIIPAYNEALRLPITLEKIKIFFESVKPFSLKEVIVVDDGSSDNTSLIAKDFTDRLPVKVVTLNKNCGKGAAVRAGVKAAVSDWVFIYDADAATPIEELINFFIASQKSDIVIGSRVGQSDRTVVMSRWRRFVGWCFHTLCAPLLPDIADASCGAKLFSYKAAQTIFSEQKLNRFAFDIEILWLAKKLGYKIAELPVEWFAVPGSKVSIVRDSWEMFWSVINLYWRALRSRLQKHIWAILVAMLIGVIYIAPHLYFAYDLGDEYQGVYMSGSYDEVFYYNLIRQVYDGESVVLNPYLVEYPVTSISSFYRPIEYTIGLVGKTLNLSITQIAISSKFIFPGLIFLTIYLFGYIISGSRSASLVAGMAVLLGSELAPLNLDSAWRTLILDSPFHSFLTYNRPVNPQISVIFFFSNLSLLAQVWLSPHLKRYVVLAGILTGLLAYIYFFFWNFTLILIGLLLLAAIFKKDKLLIKSLVSVLGLSLVVSLPFLFKMLATLSVGIASVQKNYVLTHRFIVEKVILLPLLLLTTVYAWNYLMTKLNYPSKRVFVWFDQAKFYFLYILIWAGFWASNQQMIHGHEVQQHHYHFMTNIPVFIIVTVIIGTIFLNQYFNRLKPYLMGLSIVIIIWSGISVQTSSYRFLLPLFTNSQAYAGAFNWFNQNTAVNEVVYASRELEELVPMYTHNAVYDALHASVYPIPLERLEHNYFLGMMLNGVTTGQAKEYLYTNRNDVGQRIFEGQYWRAVCGSFGCFPDTVLDDLVTKYQLFVAKPLEWQFRRYQVDYMLWDQSKHPQWQLDRLGFLKEVWCKDKLSIWRF